jgi:membrane-associated protease RseP (regulator of RpoE activity)
VKAVLGEKKIQAPPAFAFGMPRAKMKSFSSPNFHMAPDDDQLKSLDHLEMLGDEGAFNFQPYIHLDDREFRRQMRLGLQIQDTEEGGNVKVIDVQEGSAAEKAGLKKDDIITEIDGHKIDNTDDAREQLMPDESKTAYTIKGKTRGL